VLRGAIAIHGDCVHPLLRAAIYSAAAVAISNALLVDELDRILLGPLSQAIARAAAAVLSLPGTPATANADAVQLQRGAVQIVNGFHPKSTGRWSNKWGPPLSRGSRIAA
jgi:hypothetical protein